MKTNAFFCYKNDTLNEQTEPTWLVLSTENFVTHIDTVQLNCSVIAYDQETVNQRQPAFFYHVYWWNQYNKERKRELSLKRNSEPFLSLTNELWNDC